MAILYWDSKIKNGNTPSKLAKLAPAPRVTKIAGRAQHINVDVEAKREKKLAALSCMLLFYHLNRCGIKAVIENVFLNTSAVYFCVWRIV